MGGLLTCCQDSKETLEQDEVDETSRLLSSPISNNTRPSDGYNTPVPSHSQKGDEQSALDRILRRTARNVIDVNVVDAVEQHEYHDRALQYSNRVNMILGGSGKIRAYKPTLPNGISAPQTVLAAHPISLSDIHFISNTAEKASKAVKEIKVQHKEDLVVPFGVP